MGEDLHHYYVRIFGQLLTPSSEDSVVLTIKANWQDDFGVNHLATWNGTENEENPDYSDTFYVSDFDYTTNSWVLSHPLDLYVLNQSGWGSNYWRGSLSIFWTGERNMEIYYVTISDSIGDVMVYGNHSYDQAIRDAANEYETTYPWLFRHYIVDEPYWGQIWASEYMDNIIGGETDVPTTASLITREPPQEDVDDTLLINLATDRFDNMDEFITDCFCITGNYFVSYDYPIPNPYEEGVEFAAYDAALNNQPETSLGGLNNLVHVLTDFVWGARDDFSPHKNFWFQTPAVGALRYVSQELGWRWQFRPPTPEEFRCITNIAVSCGARGIIPYRFSSDAEASNGYMETGLVDADYNHDTDTTELAGTTGLGYQWVFWKSNYDEMASMFKKLEAMSPKLMQMEYTPGSPPYILGIEEGGTDDPVDPNHYFLSSFDASALSDPDGTNAHYFSLVNRNCWPNVPYDPQGGTRHYDIHTNLTGTWILEDLATHEFFKSTDGVFYWVSFEPGQGRVFRLAQTARWIGMTNVAFDMTVPNEITLNVYANTIVNVSDEVTITAATGTNTEGIINVDEGAEFYFGQDAGMLIYGQLNASGGSGTEVLFTRAASDIVWEGIEYGPGAHAYSELQYCQVSHALTGIKIVDHDQAVVVDNCIVSGNTVGIHANGYNTTAYLSLSNSDISGNSTYGVVIEGGSTNIAGHVEYNDIDNNDHAGIVFVDGLASTVSDNSINANGTGIICMGTSHPTIRSYNTISGSTSEYGIKILDSANPFLGYHATNLGYNNIYDNYSYEIYNTSTSLIYLDGNYWGYEDPHNLWSQLIYNLNRVHLCCWSSEFNVRGDALGGRDLRKHRKLEEAGDGGGEPGVVLQSAFELLYSANPQQAALLFQQIIVNFPNQLIAQQALMGLYQAYLNLENLPNFLPLLANLIGDMPTGDLKEQATYLESVVTRSLGNSNQALELVQGLAQTATQANFVALAKFDAAKIYKYDLNQPTLGDSLLQVFIVAYPEGDLSILAQVELGLIDPPLEVYGCSEPITTTQVAPQLDTYRLDAPYPNPFNPATTISYKLGAASRVNLRVYDISGKLVTTLWDGWREAGTHEVSFDGSKLSSGLYFVRMQAGDFTAVKKMMLVK